MLHIVFAQTSNSETIEDQYPEFHSNIIFSILYHDQQCQRPFTYHVISIITLSMRTARAM